MSVVVVAVVTFNAMPLETPPPGPGVLTVTIKFPIVAISVAVMAACKFVLLINVVVRLVPFQRTVELLAKFDPFTASVKPGSPAKAMGGDNAAKTGTGALPAMDSLSGSEVLGRLLTSPP